MKNGEYNLVVAPDWYRGKRYRGNYCYEHHLVWEQEYGIPVPDGYIIHHSDGNKRNNRIDNLELIEKKEHTKIHRLKHGRLYSVLRCPECKGLFEREARYLPFKNLVFCSRQCVGKYYGNGKVPEYREKRDKKENVVGFVRKFIGV